MMQNKQYILILVALLVLGGLGFYFVSNSADSEDAMMDDSKSSLLDDDDKMMENEKVADDKMVKEDAAMMEAPDSALQYTIFEGSVSYIVQKGWVSKPTEPVEGVTTDVTGSGWLVPDSGALYLNATVDLTTLKTSSDDRDKDVQKRLDEHKAMLVLDLDTSDITLDTPFSVQVPTMLTVNGVEQEVTFDVTGTVTETGFDAKGTTTALMSDFNMEAPSALGLYEVTDEFEMTFDVTGVVETL